MGCPSGHPDQSYLCTWLPCTPPFPLPGLGGDRVRLIPNLPLVDLSPNKCRSVSSPCSNARPGLGTQHGGRSLSTRSSGAGHAEGVLAGPPKPCRESTAGTLLWPLSHQEPPSPMHGWGWGDSGTSAPVVITNSQPRRNHLNCQFCLSADKHLTPGARGTQPGPLQIRSTASSHSKGRGHLLGVKSQSPRCRSPARHTLLPRAEIRLEKLCMCVESCGCGLGPSPVRLG